MDVLINIIMYSIGNLFLGIFLTIVGVLLMFFIIQSWYRNSKFSVISYIVGAILFLFLSYQSVLLCGSVTVKSYCDDVETAINGWVSPIPENISFTQSDSQLILEKITKEWPLVGYFVGGADFTGHTSADIAESMMDELKVFMNWFILRRVLWSVLFIVISAALVIKTMDKISRNSFSHRSRTSSRSRRKSYDDL